jgi:hypothetical protein
MALIGRSARRARLAGLALLTEIAACPEGRPAAEPSTVRPHRRSSEGTLIDAMTAMRAALFRAAAIRARGGGVARGSDLGKERYAPIDHAAPIAR